MSSGAVKEELLRKLGYVKKITGEAEELLKDSNVNPDTYELVDTVKMLTEMNGLLLEQIRSGRPSEDPAVESRFKQLGNQMIEIKRAELALSMDQVEIDVLDRIKNKKLP